MNNSTYQEESPPHAPRKHDMMKMGLYIGFLIVGLIGNATVIWVLAAKQRQNRINEMFVFSLIISDLLALLNTLPVNIYSMYYPRPHFLMYCKLINPLTTLLYIAGLYTITSMAVFRSHLVVRRTRSSMSKRVACKWIGGIWLGACCIVAPLSVVNTPDPAGCYENWPSFNHRKAYTAVLFVLLYLLPLLIIAVAYTRVAVFLIQSRVPITSLSGDAQPAERNYSDRRENFPVIRMLAAIVVLFVLCMLPQQVGWIMLDFTNTTENAEAIGMLIKIGHISYFFHATFDPCIYAFFIKQFRTDFRQVIRSTFTCGVSTNSTVPQLEM